jgi:hypothetical protein
MTGEIYDNNNNYFDVDFIIWLHLKKKNSSIPHHSNTNGSQTLHGSHHHFHFGIIELALII